MAMRSAAASSGGFLSKGIVRKIGPDFLPIEALDSLKKCLPNNTTSSNNKEIAGGESSRHNVNRSMFAGGNIQFSKAYIDQVSRDGGGVKKHKRTWKPNLQLKRIFSYLHGCDIQPKVTIHVVKSVERDGGIFKSVLKTPYYKQETTMGLMWKGRIERKWVEFWNKEVGYFSPEEEAKIAKVLSRNHLTNKAREENARKAQAKANQMASTASNQAAGAKQTVKEKPKANRLPS